MTKPTTRAFFIGRATADLLRERVETTLTDLVSQVGKLVVEWQVNWQAFADDVLVRVEQEQHLETGIPGNSPLQTTDLQATLDDLRAEVAQLRSELQKYRGRLA